MIIGLLGFIGSGKGTVASRLVQSHNFRQDSFAASLKDACATIFDWPRHLLEGDTGESRVWRETVDQWWADKLNIPQFTPRLALQLIGTDVLRNHFNPDIWFLTMQNRIRKSPDQSVVISDVRFPNEIEFLKQSGGILVRVSRGMDPIWYRTAVAANAGNEESIEIMKKSFPKAHLSEWAWVGSKLDFHITNNGSLDDLYKQVDDLILKI